MHALVIERAASPVAPNIRYATDWPDLPAPGPGMVNVRTLCSALNHLDLWTARGLPGTGFGFPCVGGSDACGVIEAVGAGVDASWVGRRVILNAAVAQPDAVRPGDPPMLMTPNYRLIGEHSQGTHAQMFAAPAANVQAIPDSIDPAEAAAYGLTFLTAYSMVVTKAGVKPGQTVLITGIGGGVALAALALCKHFGAKVCVTSRSQAKIDRAMGLGADHGVLDTGADWSGAVRGWTGKRGVDVAVDSSGKATHLACIKSLARGGAYVTPGCTSGPDATTDLARIFWNQLRIMGSTMGDNREFAEVAALLRKGAVRAAVDRVYPAREGAAAYARLEAGEQFGKVVIDWRK